MTWEGYGKKLERVFTFTMDNPNLGKAVVDTDVEALQKKHAGSEIAVLQQGGACEFLKIDKYEGCAETHLISRSPNDNYGNKNHILAGPYG